MHIAGLGTARPTYRFAQQDAASMAAALTHASEHQRRRLHGLYRRTRISHRGSVLLDGQAQQPVQHGATPANGSIAGDQTPAVRDANLLRTFYPDVSVNGAHGPGVAQRLAEYQRYALPLAIQAAERALCDANVDRDAIGQLVVATCTGAGSPGLEVRLVEALGLEAGTGRTMIGFMGCYAAINAMRVARGLALAERGQHVLLVAVELCSLHFHYENTSDKVLANALFADGAAAMVLRAHDEDAPVDLPRVRNTATYLIPGTADRMSWTVGNHGFEMTLASDVPAIIERSLGAWVDSWLAGQGLHRHAIAGWAIHPGGPRIIEATLDALSLPASAGEASRTILRECGNMSSPTVLFIYEQLRAQRVTGPVVMLAFGPGLVVEAALIT